MALVLAGCAVDAGGLPGQDGATGCGDDTACNDGVDCTRDSCAAGACVHAADSSQCETNEYCDERSGCLPAIPCDPAECRDSLANPAACQLGVCEPDGTCLGQSTCAPGQICCGDGSCMGCDDDNPCTADSCDAGGCINEPLTGIECDNGSFCDGIETCDAGVCQPGSNPCVGDTVCEETTDRCTGCLNNGDCPAMTMTGWSTCAFEGDSTCDESGRQSRTVTTYSCVAEECVPDADVQMRNCSRTTENDTCAPTTQTPWSGCRYGGNVCANSGTRTRDRTTHQCGSGVCESSTVTLMDMTGCARDTAGDSCGATVFGDWSDCGGFSDDCDQTGSRSRTNMVSECASGSCQPRDVEETDDTCTRTTTGTTCGSPQTVMGSCMPATGERCSTAGERVITETTFACGAGSCMATIGTRTESCTLDTDGAPCEPANPCAGACSGGICDANAANGISCDDGLDCTDPDRCTGGVCTGDDTCSGGDCNSSGMCGSACFCKPTGMCGCP